MNIVEECRNTDVILTEAGKNRIHAAFKKLLSADHTVVTVFDSAYRELLSQNMFAPLPWKLNLRHVGKPRTPVLLVVHEAGAYLGYLACMSKHDASANMRRQPGVFAFMWLPDECQEVNITSWASITITDPSDESVGY